MTVQREQGWLPDLIYRDGHFENNLALFVSDGLVTRFSSSPEDLQSAHRLPRRAILPGLVNAHSHTFQRAIRGRTEHRTTAARDSFWTWREAMYHAARQLSPEEIGDVARMAFLEMIASGITAAGEFHYLHHAPDGTFYDDPNLLAGEVLQAAHDVGLRIALLKTAYARSGWNTAPNPGQTRFITPKVEEFLRHTDRLRSSLSQNGWPPQAWLGVAPHSVRAVSLPYLQEVTGYARQNGLKIHMHVSEQPAEIEACLAEHGLRPFELLHKYNILSSNFTGVHSIHLTDEEIGFLGDAGARVCACGTTERNLGDGIAPADKFAQSGVGVCYGSDSNIQIDLLEDARELEYHLRLKHLGRNLLAPDMGEGSLARQLFANATEEGAASLGAPGGSLAVGKAADFFTVNLDDISIAGASNESLLSNIVFSAERTAIRDAVVGGREVLTDGRHPLQEKIVQRFAAVQKKLWGSAV